MSVINVLSLPGTEIGRDMKQPGSVLVELTDEQGEERFHRLHVDDIFSQEMKDWMTKTYAVADLVDINMVALLDIGNLPEHLMSEIVEVDSLEDLEDMIRDEVEARDYFEGIEDEFVEFETWKEMRAHRRREQDRKATEKFELATELHRLCHIKHENGGCEECALSGFDLKEGCLLGDDWKKLCGMEAPLEFTEFFFR